MTQLPQLLHYDLGEGVTAFSSTRHGGVSEGNYAEFNINYYCGDLVSHIEANRQTLCRLLGIDENHLVYPHQVHGVEVRQIDGEFFSLSSAERKMVLEGVDAVRTDLRGVCVGVSTADCIPLLIYDEAHHAVCAVHAGWRGTVARVAQKAVTEMHRVYSSSPADLRVVVGPGISLENFEVGDEVYERFAEAGFPMESIARRYKKWHIDLWECNRLQFIQLGVSPSNIQVSGICTFAQADDFFSARRLGIDSGRIFTGIYLSTNS
uniref:Purine nucleoside phosphorylase n=1 Tax=uncultured bacterium Csd4 TaxID=1637487 RepID=A0A0F6WGI1_9BACT|nr:polyphenol oxidase laccase [uncultured bacterium Csd4]